MRGKKKQSKESGTHLDLRGQSELEVERSLAGSQAYQQECRFGNKAKDESDLEVGSAKRGRD